MVRTQEEGSVSGKATRGRRTGAEGSTARETDKRSRRMDNDVDESESKELEMLDKIEPASAMTSPPGSSQVPGKPHGSLEALMATAVELCFRVVGLTVALYLAPQRYAWRLFVQMVALMEAILGRFLKWSGVQTAAEKKAEIRGQEVHRLQSQLGRLRDRHQDALSKIEQLKRERTQLQADLSKLQELTNASMSEGSAQGGRTFHFPSTGHRPQLLLHFSVALTGISTFFFFHKHITTDPYKAYLLLGKCGMIAWLYISSMRMRVTSRRSSTYAMCLSWFITTYIWAVILWRDWDSAAYPADAWATIITRE